jgi:hypothetical protein
MSETKNWILQGSYFETRKGKMGTEPDILVLHGLYGASFLSSTVGLFHNGTA